MALSIILFIVGLALLVFGGDWFVDSACGLARKFKIPEIIVGATIVSIGTTLPEVLVSATGAATGHGEIAYGNAIGSIICNTALILAIVLAIKPPKNASRRTLILPICFFFGAAIFYSAVSYFTGYFNRGVGIVLVISFIIFMILTIRDGFKHPEEIEKEDVKEYPLWRDIVFLIIGAAFIAVGAKLLVEYGTKIAQDFGVPESVIALSFVALGTSLPELVTAIVSLAKGHASLSLGNIIGANLFNLVLVSGVAITIKPFTIPLSKLFMGMNASLVIDIPLMFIVMLLVCLPVLIKGKLYRWQGIILLVLYAGFITFQFIN